MQEPTMTNLQTTKDHPYWSIIIGNIRLAPASNPNMITIEKDNGESGEFDASKFREMLERFFDENF